MKSLIAFLVFAGSIPAANWMIGNVGECIPGGPCVIPVGFGLTAPSGVLVVGAALVARDIIHELEGALEAFVAIVVGSIAALIFARPELVIASAASFALSELADFAVYTPLRRRKLALALFASGLVGAIVDSAVFLFLAFGSLDFIAGQIVGKTLISFVAGLAIVAMHAKPRKA
jgi:uncharacterized PurR-regulated membrane protein YhhQ (DUF165 family)